MAGGWWDAPPMLQELCPQDFLPLPLAPRISGSSDRRRPWLQPGCFRPVQRYPGPSKAPYAEPSGSSNNARPPVMAINGDDVMEASLLRLLRRNQDLPPLQKRRGEMGCQDPQALLPYKQISPGL